jgi:molecular chaperone DnaK (HSP70)
VVGTDPLTKRKRNGILIPRNTPLPVTAKRTFRTQKAGQRSILVQVVEGESASPDDCSQLGRCTVRHLPQGLAVQTPIDVLFHYQTNGRLKVKVSIPDTEAKVEAEFARENSLPKEHLDGWRRYISGAEPTDYT